MLLEDANPVPTELAYEEPEFGNDVLPRTGIELRSLIPGRTHIVWRQQDQSKADIRVTFELLDDRTA